MKSLKNTIMRMFKSLVIATAIISASTSAKAAVINFSNFSSVSGSDLVVTLGTTITNDPAVYLVGTMSFLPNASTASFTEAHFRNGATNLMGMGKAFGSAQIVLASDGTVTNATGFLVDTTAGATTTYLMVVKVNQTTGAGTIWVNPNLGLEESANTTKFSGTKAGQGSFTDLSFRNGASTNVDYTGFSVHYGGSTPFAVPEPGSIALLGVGVLLLGLRRRR